MANYTELSALRGNAGWDGLIERISIACIVMAHAITQEATPVEKRIAWARSTVKDPRAAAYCIVWNVISAAYAANPNITTAQIMGASDAAIQTIVDSTIPMLCGI